MITPNIDDFYLLNDILQRNYFDYFKKGKKNLEFLLSSNTLSLNRCSNCNTINLDIYSQQNIFTPTKTNKYENLLLIIDWYIQNKFICDIEFNGCIENEDHTDFINNINKIIDKFNNKNNHPKNIIFHTRMGDIDFINNILNLFKNSNICPIFFIHINGYYCDTLNYKEEYYHKIIQSTINHSSYYYIIDINPNNIKNQIKNYKWWISNLGLENFIKKIHFNEYLNDNWNYENIQEYLNFLNFQIDFLSKNLKDFKTYIFNKTFTNFNNPFTIQILDQEILTNKKYYQDCLFHNGLSIDLNTLKIPACCKLNYPIYHIGEIKQENNTLKINPINLSALITKAHLKRSSTPHCEYCSYLNLCQKTCYGENFNISYNFLCPIRESCLLTQCKYNFLIYKYNSMNLLNLEDYDLTIAFKNDLTLLKEKIFKEELK